MDDGSIDMHGLAIARGRQRASITASSGTKTVVIPFKDILYFKAEDKWTTVRHKGGESIISDALVSLESEYGEALVRVHRNMLVRPHLIREYGTYPKPCTYCYVKIEGVEGRMCMSRRNLKHVKACLQGERAPAQ